MAVMREVNSQVLQQLRDSVSRVSTLAQCMRDAVHREGTSGASDDLHDINTSVATVSKQVLSSDKNFNRGEIQPRPGILLRRDYRAGMALAPLLIRLQWRMGLA